MLEGPIHEVRGWGRKVVGGCRRVHRRLKGLVEEEEKRGVGRLTMGVQAGQV